MKDLFCWSAFLQEVVLDSSDSSCCLNPFSHQACQFYCEYSRSVLCWGLNVGLLFFGFPLKSICRITQLLPGVWWDRQGCGIKWRLVWSSWSDKGGLKTPFQPCSQDPSSSCGDLSTAASTWCLRGMKNDKKIIICRLLWALGLFDQLQLHVAAPPCREATQLQF